MMLNWKNEIFNDSPEENLLWLLNTSAATKSTGRATQSRLRLIAPKEKLISSIQAFSGKSEY